MVTIHVNKIEGLVRKRGKTYGGFAFVQFYDTALKQRIKPQMVERSEIKVKKVKFDWLQ